MEGLEISIVKKSEAFEPFFNARFDPEFFQKYYTDIYKNILCKDHEFLGEFAFITDGEHGNAVTSEIGYSKYYGARNVLSGILSDNNVEYISEQHHKKLRKSALAPRDVLISCVGANIGYAAIVPDDIGIANIVRNVALIRSNSCEFANEYLHAYFCSSYGKNLYIRMNTGNAQPLVSLDYIKTLPVYKPSIDFQNKIKNLVNFSLNALRKSKNTYVSAEMVLLNTLGMGDFSPSADAINVKSFKDSFAATGRLDAEYYQPKYEDYEQTVINHSAGFTTIAAEFDLVKETSQREKSAYNYIEISDVSIGDGAANFNRLDIGELPANAKKEVRRGDLLISKVRPNRGAVAIIDFDDTDLIVSGAFTVLRARTDSIFSNETLKVLLRTPMYRDWMLKFNIGTQYPVIRDEDILNLPIPFIDEKTQEKVATLVKESFSLKLESERLLQFAKRAVEIAIEQNENTGMAYIKANS